MTQQHEPIKEVYFKNVMTDEIKMYLVNPLWTVKQFMFIIKRKITEDFNVGEFVLVDIQAMLLVSSNEILSRLYGPDLDVAFYIIPNHISM